MNGLLPAKIMPPVVHKLVDNDLPSGHWEWIPRVCRQVFCP